jgi:hypothetical protein
LGDRERREAAAVQRASLSPDSSAYWWGLPIAQHSALQPSMLLRLQA